MLWGIKTLEAIYTAVVRAEMLSNLYHLQFSVFTLPDKKVFCIMVLFNTSTTPQKYIYFEKLTADQDLIFCGYLMSSVIFF